MTEQQTTYGIKTPVVFRTPEIFKVKKPNGTRTYENDAGYEVQFRTLSLDAILDDHIIHFQAIDELTENEHAYNYLFKTLIIRLENEMKTLYHFIRQEIGEIQVDISDDQIIGVSVLSKNTEKR